MGVHGILREKSRLDHGGGGFRNDLLPIGYGDGDVNGYGHGVPRGGRIPCRAERP